MRGCTIVIVGLTSLLINWIVVGRLRYLSIVAVATVVATTAALSCVAAARFVSPISTADNKQTDNTTHHNTNKQTKHTETKTKPKQTKDADPMADGTTGTSKYCHIRVSAVSVHVLALLQQCHVCLARWVTRLGLGGWVGGFLFI